MALAFHRKHLALDAHHPLWLWIAVAAAFLLVALWAQPIG